MPTAAMQREAWRVAICGALALAVAMGIGRFAFTPLLPMMLHDGVVDLNAGGWPRRIISATLLAPCSAWYCVAARSASSGWAWSPRYC